MELIGNIVGKKMFCIAYVNFDCPWSNATRTEHSRDKIAAINHDAMIHLEAAKTV